MSRRRDGDGVFHHPGRSADQRTGSARCTTADTGRKTAPALASLSWHLRAITNLPLPTPVVNNPSVMVNLIGSDLELRLAEATAGTHLHWYDKEVREGRKVDHLNLSDSDTARLARHWKRLSPLPPEYASGIIWGAVKAEIRRRGRYTRPFLQTDTGSSVARQRIFNA